MFCCLAITQSLLSLEPETLVEIALPVSFICLTTVIIVVTIVLVYNPVSPRVLTHPRNIAKPLAAESALFVLC